MAGLRGRTFGGYQLVEQLPGGGIADVYRGRPTKAGGRDVVVKVIYPEFAHQPGFLPHFRQIVASSTKLASHPHILPLIASGEDSGYLYLVTPYVEAGTLRDWVRKGGRMSAGDAAPFFRQLCDALTYAHSLSVVHGNLKPSNIFLFEGRHVLVGDFGILWDVSHMDMNHAGSGTETVEFLAPEVLSGHVTQLSDIYSVGALLFAALTGRAPFQAATPADVFAAAARQPVPHLAQANPALPAPTQALDSVIQRALAKRPEDRFPSAAAVAQSIETCARQVAASAPLPAFAAEAGVPFVPMSGPAPFGSMQLSPQQHPAAFPAPGPLPQGGAMPAGGLPFPAPGGAFPAPAISLAQAAAAIGSGAISSLGQLDPPFPPLPSAAQPEAQMEQARIGGLNGTGMQPAVHPRGGVLPFSESTIHVPAPASGDMPQQTTARVPAPALPTVSGAPDIPQQPTLRVPTADLSAPPSAPWQPGAFPDMPPGSDAPPAGRAIRISGAPRARLGRPAEPFPTLDDDEEDFAPQNMPAIRPPLGQNGFAVAGGTGSFDPGARGMSSPRNAGFAQEALPGSAPLDGGMPDSAALDRAGFSGPSDPSGTSGFGGRVGESGMLDGSAPFGGSGMLGGADAGYADFAASVGQAWGGAPGVDGFGARSGWHDGYTGEQAGYSPQSDGRSGGDGRAGGQGWGEYRGGYTGEYDAQFSSEFSAQPRAGYGGEEHGVSATQLGLPRLTSPVLVDQPPSWQELLSEPGGHPGAMAAGPGMPAMRNSAGERAPTWQDAGESMWQAAVKPPPSQEPRVPAHVEAEWMGNGVAPGWDVQADSSGKRKKNKGKGSLPDEPEDSGFDDDRVWTRGTTAVRVRKRWPRKLALLLLLILLIDLAALVVLRPDLCPNQSCRTLSATIRHQLGLSQSTPAPAPFAATPSSVTLTVAAGKSSSASVSVSNDTGKTATWKASAGLPWITVSPASGTLATNGAATLLITAKPTNVKAGAYTTKITVTFTGASASASAQTLTIPVTITVTG